MKKRVFYKELAYIFGLLIMAASAAFSVKADFGLSMIIAPAYIIHLKVSELLPWFTFGVAEYFFQGLLVVLTAIIMRRFKLHYLFSFVTAVIYGTLLDAVSLIIAPLPVDTVGIRLVWYVVGIVFCSFAVSLFFHTYLSPEAYELIVKEISAGFGLNINKVKTTYDCCSTVLAVVLSFIFFGFGVFKGMSWGTIVCALVNGFLISRFTRLLESVFEFKSGLKIERYFDS